MAEINIDIDAIADQVISKEVATTDKTSQIITSTSATSNNAKQVDFLGKLSDEQQLAIKQKAPELVQKFVADQNAILDFGTPAVESVNSAVNKVLEEQRKISIPQVDDILRSANREIAGFTTKYKGKDLAELDKKRGAIAKIFHLGAQSLKDMYFDSQKIENKLDTLGAQLIRHEDTLARNIVSSEMLVAENVKSIDNLVGVIAFIEATRDEAAALAKTKQKELTKLDKNSVEYHTKNEELSRVTEVINALEQQHTDYVSRLYVSWATTPQMRNLIRVSSDLRQRLGMLRRNTLPTMKLNIAQLGILQQSIGAGKAADAIINANNKALQTLAATAKDAIPSLEESAGKPSLTVDSVIKIAESLIAQNEGIINAIETARDKRAIVEQQIVQSAEMINDSTKIRDQQIVSVILDNAKDEQKSIEGSAELNKVI